MSGAFKSKLVADVGEKRHVAGSLDGDGQLTLMHSTSAGNASGKDLGTLTYTLAESDDDFLVLR